MNINLTSRMRNGLVFQGGTSTGRGVRDTCETSTKIDSPDPRNCAVTEPLMTSFTGNASYTVPKIDVLVSGQICSRNPANIGATGGASASNGASLNANTLVPNTVVQQLLGRLPGVALPTQNTTVNLLETGQMYPADRLNQVDMRFAKIVRFSNRRLDIAVDLYNLFNTNDATGFDGNYDYSQGNTLQGGEWLSPTNIVAPRFVRVNFTLSY